MPLSGWALFAVEVEEAEWLWLPSFGSVLVEWCVMVVGVCVCRNERWRR